MHKTVSLTDIVLEYKKMERNNNFNNECINYTKENHNDYEECEENTDVSYEFFVYFYPYETDNQLAPFRSNQDFKCDLLRLRENSTKDCIRHVYYRNLDRRIRAIETKSDCHICIGDLECKFIKGMPMRRVTIVGKDYDQIAKCLTIMSYTMPNLLEYAHFLTPLNAKVTNWPTPGNMVVRPLNKTAISSFRPTPNTNTTRGWQAKVDPCRIFPPSIISTKCYSAKHL